MRNIFWLSDGLSEWAVRSSGGVWHDYDVFCCCFDHKASCFSVGAVIKKKHILPSFQKNRRDVRAEAHGSASQFTGSAFICKHWGWKDKVVKQTHACLSLCIQEVELACCSRLLLSQWVCAHYLSVVWFPSCCVWPKTCVWFGQTPHLPQHFQVNHWNLRDFLRTLPCHIIGSTHWPQWLRSVRPFHSYDTGAEVILTEGTWLGHVVVTFTWLWHTLSRFSQCRIACHAVLLEVIAWKNAAKWHCALLPHSRVSHISWISFLCCFHTSTLCK